jgi:ATP-dependent Clp endopeptidase proteolytic subunit ClpP
MMPNQPSSQSDRQPRNAVNDAGEILLYGTVGDYWDGLDAKTLCEKIAAMGDVETITVRINSGGGYIVDGLAIYNYLKQHKAKVKVMIDGLAASMASVIAMAGDDIIMPKNALMMIHNPWNIAIGDAETFRKEADKLDTLKASLVTIYADKTGISNKKLNQMMDDETWLNADDAKAMAFCTEIAGSTDEKGMGSLNLAGFNYEQIPSALFRAQLNALGPDAAPGTKEVVVPSNDEEHEMPKETVETVTPAVNEAQVTAAVNAAVAARTERDQAIRAKVRIAGLPETFADELIRDAANLTVDQASAKIVDKWAANGGAAQPQSPNAVRVDVISDESTKFRAGAMAWIFHKAGVANLVGSHTKQTFDPGEFRGMTMVELARMSLERMGISTKGMDKMHMVGHALTARHGVLSAQGAVYQGTSDFTYILENVMHKTLLAAYGTTPDTWSRFCKRGSVSDFRAHYRYRQGTFGSLDTVTEHGEFKNKTIPDATRESITASTKGNIIALSRQAIINDDMGAFNDLAARFGRAAKLSIEVDVYALLALNSNLGPTMSDSVAMFDAAHNNISTGAALSASAIDADRVKLAQQTDPSGNEYLDLRPAILLLPIGLGSTARVINESVYDPDTVANKAQMKPNAVNGLFRDIIDTPRLSGTRRYLFADPSVAPTIEVAFLDGVEEPFMDNQTGWRVDGTEWKVRLDYGVGGVDWRGAITNAGV